MGYASKTFVSFDGDSDMHYYQLMTAWKQHDHMSFNFYNAQDVTPYDDTERESFQMFS